MIYMECLSNDALACLAILATVIGAFVDEAHDC